MQRIVVAAKAGADQPWVADAVAQLAAQTGADVNVVRLYGLEMEALSTTPRSEYADRARESAEALVLRLRADGVEATAETRAGAVVPGILLYAEEHDADIIVVGATSRGRVAARVLGDVPLELAKRSRRPVLIVAHPPEQ
jgi:nucleotide-binding universal stress UspA family protein